MGAKECMRELEIEWERNESSQRNSKNKVIYLNLLAIYKYYTRPHTIKYTQTVICFVTQSMG